MLIEHWLVVEKDPYSDQILFTGKFENYADAKNMYDQLQTMNEHTVISIEKSTKTFLVEG